MPLFIVYKWDGRRGFADRCCPRSHPSYNTRFELRAEGMSAYMHARIYGGACVRATPVRHGGRWLLVAIAPVR